MRNIEELMADLVKSSIVLKRRLYRRDEFSSTTPEGTEGPRIPVHSCRLCGRSAAGEGAQVRHRSSCALARLQKAQKSLGAAWPELFQGRETAQKIKPKTTP